MDESAATRRGSSMSVMLRVLIAQTLSGVVLAALFWSTMGHVAGYSALIGSLICVVPSAFLALRLAVPRRDPGAGALMRAAYVGELGKLALTVLMFGVVFVAVRPLAAAPLFAGFIVAQLVTFSGLLMRDHGQDDRQQERTQEQKMETRHGG